MSFRVFHVDALTLMKHYDSYFSVGIVVVVVRGDEFALCVDKMKYAHSNNAISVEWRARAIASN